MIINRWVFQSILGSQLLFPPYEEKRIYCKSIKQYKTLVLTDMFAQLKISFHFCDNPLTLTLCCIVKYFLVSSQSETSVCYREAKDDGMLGMLQYQ